MPPQILSDILRFIGAANVLEPADRASEFDQLASRALAWQLPRVEALERLWIGHGLNPQASQFDWRQAPPVPTRSFATETLAAEPASLIFSSSGTSRGPAARSQHHMPFLDLYRTILDASFAPSCLPAAETRPAILSLVPLASALPDSSLSFMADHVIESHAGVDVGWALGAEGVDLDAALQWLTVQETNEQPVLIFSTAFALLQLLDGLPRAFELPAGSVVFETGGFKGRTREILRSDLVARVHEGLAVPPGKVVREYGMSELSSQCYSRALQGGDPDLLFPPPWMRVRVLNPTDMTPCQDGEAGVLAFFDLGNLGSTLAVQSEDVGISDGLGFRLQGRVEGSELRGCSLTAEEFTAAKQEAAS